MRLASSVCLVALLSPVFVRPAAAQAAAAAAGPAAMPSKPVMVEMWNRTRDNTVRYLRAAPDSMMGFRTTPGVRTYAEQVVHAVESNLEIVGMSLGRRAPAPPAAAGSDQAARLRSKEALLAYVTWSYDQVVAMLNDATPARLAGDTTLFGARRAMPRWRWIEGSREHDAFTLGQTVPYLRMNGVTPPEFKEF